MPSKFPLSDPKWLFRIKFEESIDLDEMWIDSVTLDYLNSFRENIFVSQGFPITAALTPIQNMGNSANEVSTRSSRRNRSSVRKTVYDHEIVQSKY